MAEYYFLASFLPQLEIGHMPPLNFAELKELIRINVNQKDLKKVHKFLELIDLENLRALWAHEPLDPRGNYTKEELEEAITQKVWPLDVDFAPYLQDFFEDYPKSEDRLAHFPRLLSQFLDFESEEESGFLKDYFAFERQWRLVMAGFRAKKWHRSLEAELQYEDSNDPIVAQILAQKDAKTYEPPFEFKELKPIFDAYADSPLEMHQALYHYRFDAIQELVGGQTFSIDYILGYMARHLIVEKWLEIDVQKGIQIVDTIEKDIR